MKKSTASMIAFIFFILFGQYMHLGAADNNYGAAGASKLPDKALTLEKMLIHAIEDEYLARGEYEKVIEKFGSRAPFTNIIKAEERHISWLVPLLKKYKASLPADRGLELAIVPPTFDEALKIGVEAEVANIAMYERFLKKDLPDDVRDVFKRLLAGSKNHLSAFKRGGRDR